MTVPISNTSPLTNLAAIGQFDLLQRLYGRLLIAEAVWEELNTEGRTGPGRAGLKWRRRTGSSGGQCKTSRW